MLTRRNFTFALAASAGAASVAYAKTAYGSPVSHGVMMLNADCSDANVLNVFEPAIIRVQPGDMVTFIPSDSGHNTASKRGMIPDGADPWNSTVDERLTITPTVPGIYGYLCLPHYEMGMVGVIVVGDDLSSLEAVKKARHPGHARKAFRMLLEQLDT
ncbi:pseudoazurin [uncultured Roseobacter sp.]|uniref:pseudoazurin n=1 Tax=uncultured Roseobacter sp. TaxID=114847 RepID=UPI002607CAC9|nr:pseudoazurin [uncultured Roseobacter sp.]